MKVSAIVAVVAATAGAAAQAPPAGAPDCVVTCTQNMLNQAELGCAASDVACLCRNPNFTYGVHDCTWANCGYNTDQLNIAMQWANTLCASAGVTIPSITGTPATPTDGAAGTGTPPAGAVTPTAVTTSVFTTVITDAAGSVTTQTASTVISGLNGTPGASVVPTSLTATLVATGDGFSSVVGATTLVTSATVGPTDDATPASSDVAESTTSSGLGAQVTAAPAAGFLAAAGIAALLL